MSTPVAEKEAAIEPRPRRWTKAEFYWLAELGLFQGQRAELIEGQIMVLSPQKWQHAVTVDRVAELLKASWSDAWVRMQLPLDLSAASDPEPDISVVAGSRDNYKNHPKAALLVVEVSDTTLEYDRTRKASLYASAGIADYWIINLLARQLEVFRNPVPDAAQPYGYRYAEPTVYFSDLAVSPLARPDLSIPVKELLD